MVIFPNAKINLGLHITQKRDDGFHNLETIFAPIDLCDILEFVEAKEFKFTTSGLEIDGESSNNLCIKAYNLLKQDYKIPNIEIHLHKVIPFGAGLGGGSSDAAFLIKGLNKLFELNISIEKQKELALQLGSDCPVFIENEAVYASGRGEIFTEIDFFHYYKIVIIKPNIFISTKEAFSLIKPKERKVSLLNLYDKFKIEWINEIENDFEKPIFQKYPLLSQIKEQMYKHGAKYASMSGSGSAVYGLFETEPDLKLFGNQNFIWKGNIINNFRVSFI
ncbi:MAG: 4-(cytidine 5'-diphospho)-2-C-methyl-D-erythritol kinase [Bacteroidetes bacterium GWA2_30_7]|nr:MAG: 4-(cytidine 5'-diphospho)-2-C-methyl-D-erythritol kinase [Bacteroidetes bacterium GWA2_30_7]